MNDSAIMFAILAVAVIGWIVVGIQAAQLRDARKQLDQADNNDARDPSTGRYVGKRT